MEEELEDEFNMTVDEEINLLKPEEIKAFLDDYVIGQDEAKKHFLLLFTIITRESLQEKIWM